MSNTTSKPQEPLKKVTAREVERRLKAARARNRELKKEGKLPEPTKEWSRASVESLKIALSGRSIVNE